MPDLLAGSFLYSLDSELNVSPSTVSEAILINGLFSRQVALSEVHLLDNPGVALFFRRHAAALMRMLDELEEGEIPLLGVCCRTGPDIEGLVDVWLDPENRGHPNYFSSLSPAQNDALRRDFLALKTKQGRAKRLYRVAGPAFEDHLGTVTKYLDRHPSGTTVPPLGQPSNTLYPRVRSELTQLQKMENAIVQDEDEKIVGRLLNAIETLPKGAVQTRDRLHKAIYDGQQPPVYQGKVLQHRDSSEPDDIKDEWRFFVNGVYNYNLAANLKLRPVLNTNWWTIGRRWMAEGALRQRLKLHDAGTFRLATPLYRNQIDFDFVRKVRKKPKFSTGIGALESAANEEVRHEAFKKHLTFLSEQLEQHLVERGLENLVGRPVNHRIVSAGKAAGFVAGPAATLFAWYGGMPLGSAAQVGLDTWTAMGLASYCIEGLFCLAPSLGGKRIHTVEFKNIMGDLERAGKHDE
jgi:hypothetical protein